MKHITVTLCLLAVILISSCKKENADPCVKDFVANWSCTFFAQSNSGTCNTGGETVTIQPGPDGGCQVLLPNLPFGCGATSNQVLGTVSGDSIHIHNEPFGNTFISGQGRVYLNQLTMQLNLANGTTTSISGTK